MLTEIRIEGLGAISSATAQFHRGLTVLTGETGAGKTMVVTGLHLLGGARADADRVRAGASRALVEGRFVIDRQAQAETAARLVEECGGHIDDDGSIIGVRTVGADGRSRAYLGGRGVPAGTLAQFTDVVLTVHGQNEQLRLQQPDQQLRALDEFAGEAVGTLRREFEKARSEWLRLRAQLTEKREHSRELLWEAEQLRASLADIDAVAPQPGEDAAIVLEARRLSDLDALLAAATRAQTALAGESDGGDEQSAGALELVGMARGAVGGCGDPELEGLGPRLDEASAVLSDVVGELSGYLGGLDADPGRLDQLLTRQAELKTLTRKYAPDIDGVIEWADEARKRLATVDVSDEALRELSDGVEAAEDRVRVVAEKLTAARVAAADELAAAVTAELAGLAMSGSRLTVEVRPLPARSAEAVLPIGGVERQVGALGMDEVEFRLQHAGGRPLALGKSASGGELSRVMLAMEVVLADSQRDITMVFDEVDAGVGGRAAVEIGRRLARLARTRQVIVVTHLAQVAAFADTHLMVDKVTDGEGQSNSGVRELTSDERVVELARMLAGLDDTETGRAHAWELLNIARAQRVATEVGAD